MLTGDLRCALETAQSFEAEAEAALAAGCWVLMRLLTCHPQVEMEADVREVGERIMLLRFFLGLLDLYSTVPYCMVMRGDAGLGCPWVRSCRFESP